jgi:hypothetical protein
MFEKMPFHTAPSARTTFRKALVAGDEEKVSDWSNVSRDHRCPPLPLHPLA